MTVSVGDSIDIFWSSDQSYHTCRVISFDDRTGRHCVLYNGGALEDINLTTVNWRIQYILPDPRYSQLGAVSLTQTQTQATASVKKEPTLLTSVIGKVVKPRPRTVKKETQPVKGGVTKKKRAPPKRKSRKRISSPRTNSSQVETTSHHDERSDSLNPTAFRLIETCADSWLKCESRRTYRWATFSVSRCISHILNMLLTAASNPIYEKALLKKKRLDSSWLATGHIEPARRDFYGHWRKKMSDVEWIEEKRLLANLSKVICGAQDEVEEQELDTDLLEAVSLVMNARSSWNQIRK